MNATPREVIKAVLVNTLTGKEFDLEEKEGSYCHFLKNEDKIPYLADFLRFRLDWEDLNAHGDPSLDTDIVDIDGKQYKEKIEAHHTTRESNGGNEYTYHFKQDKIELFFVTRLTIQRTITGTARILQDDLTNT
jgi:hypothetical protein